MLKNLLLKKIYDIFYLGFLLKSSISRNFLKFNNKRIESYMERNNEKISKISILLPHCIQKYSCPIKVTSEIENCKKCGKCRIANLIDLKKDYNVDIKVATGGTLARTYLKKQRPDLVIAVACERDLVSGIRDAFPLKVYGVFNQINGMPCIDTDVEMEKIKKVLKKISKN